MPSLTERHAAWITAAVAINVVWAFLFWFVFFVQISWNVFEVPMGLGGAVYPALFLAPVLFASLAWQALIAGLRRRWTFTRRQLLFWSLGVPCALISFFLILWCPMDSHQSYLGYVWTHLR